MASLFFFFLIVFLIIGTLYAIFEHGNHILLLLHKVLYSLEVVDRELDNNKLLVERVNILCYRKQNWFFCKGGYWRYTDTGERVSKLLQRRLDTLKDNMDALDSLKSN